LEWLFGGNPNRPDGALPGDLTLTVTNGKMHLNGRVAAAWGTFTGGVERSTHLTAWTESDAEWLMSTAPDAAGFFSLEIVHPQSTNAPLQFLRTHFRELP
jgi:hypothetical protein